MRLLPLPRDLGHPSNYLPSRLLDPNTTDYTWEDHQEVLIRRFPWRWRLQGVIDWFSRWPRISHALYWLRTHTYNRYHLLDLRDAEPEKPEGYRWGWIDRSNSLQLACFLTLRQFVEQEEPWRPDPTGYDGAALESIQAQAAAYDEIMALYRWWTVDRFVEYADWQRRSDAAHAAWKASDNDPALAKIWLDIEATENARDDEMLLRLMAVRHHLWT